MSGKKDDFLWKSYSSSVKEKWINKQSFIEMNIDVSHLWLFSEEMDWFKDLLLKIDSMRQTVKMDDNNQISKEYTLKRNVLGQITNLIFVIN